MGRSSSKRRGEVLYRPPPLPGTDDLAGQEDAVNPEFVARIMHRMKRVSLSKGTGIDSSLFYFYLFYFASIGYPLCLEASLGCACLCTDFLQRKGK